MRTVARTEPSSCPASIASSPATSEATRSTGPSRRVHSRHGRASFNGPNNKNPPELSPIAFYERIFGSTFREPGEEGVVDPTLALRRSVLDAVMADVEKINARVGAADRIRLDQHLTGIRELELRLARLAEDPPSLEACLRPAEPAAEYPEVEGRHPVSEIHRAMTDLLVMAVACDQTRVFSHWFSDPLTNKLYPGATMGHHSLTHDEPGSSQR